MTDLTKRVQLSQRARFRRGWPGGEPKKSIISNRFVSQSVTTTLLAGSSWTTHTLLFFYFEYGDYLCNVVFLSLSLVFRQGPHLRMMFFFPSLFTFASCR